MILERDEDSIECVYLIGSPGSPLVKIGRSVDVARRLADIQRMSPAPLKVLWQEAGGFEMETALHRRFHQQRAHGEWFNLGADPIALVTEAAAAIAATREAQMLLTLEIESSPEVEEEPDLDLDNPEYQPDEWGCRTRTPRECAAMGAPPGSIFECSGRHSGYH